MESYERHKAAGAMSIAVYGTPHMAALTPELQEDKTPGTSPGFGSAAANGKRLPFPFPADAACWSPAAAGAKLLMDNRRGPSHPELPTHTATIRRAGSQS